jgi:hypothetical protein
VDAVKSLTHWRRGREVKTEHTREVVRSEVPAEYARALVAMGERIERLERAIAALALEAARDG